MNNCHHSEWRRARKVHDCAVCVPANPRKDPHRYREHKIAKGELYEYNSGIFDGNPYSYKLCRMHAAMNQALYETYRDDYWCEGIDVADLRNEWSYQIEGHGRVGWLKCLHAVRKELREMRCYR